MLGRALVLLAFVMGCDDAIVADADAVVDVPDATVPLDAEPGGDAGRDGAAVTEDAAIADAGAACADPPGSACNPIAIESFPFRHEGDTTDARAALDAYACAPSTSEAGPEVHYALRLEDPRALTLTIEESAGVDVDVHVLRDADPASCLSRANTTLAQPLGAGTWRVVVDTYASLANAGAYALVVDATAPSPTELGAMWNTFYYLASEDDHEGPADTPIYDASCVEIGRVREGFHDSVCIEGSGRTSDGRIINAASTCTTSCPAARTCGGRSYRVCYAELDPARFPWGQGARSNPLEPDRSIAIDPDFVALGRWIYFAELDGLVPPGASTPHDGCMRTDDVGGGIDGNQFDFFAGTRARWLEWETQLPTGSTLTAVLDDPRCYPRP